jgi:hypothetical protein
MQKLKLSYCYDLTAAGIGKLPKGLQSLSLSNLPLTETEIEKLPKDLRSLKLSNCWLLTDAVIEKLPRLCNLYLLLSIFLLLTTSCQPNNKETSDFSLSSEEKVWLTQFFEDVMSCERGIYTLLGSKPLTMIAIEKYSDRISRKISQRSLKKVIASGDLFF